MRILVLGDADTCLAFALAGIEGKTAETESEVLDALQHLDRRNTGLVLITERLAEKARDAIDRMVLDSENPLILEIPGVDGGGTRRPDAAERIVSLLRR